ncbi:MAG: threonine ammonia-lyase, partial [Methanobacteriota archaeon]
RIFRFAVVLRDRPGELSKLLEVVARERANVRAIEHDRYGHGMAVNRAHVALEVETRGREHGEALLLRLRTAGYEASIVP